MGGNNRIAMKSFIGTRDEQQDCAFYCAQDNCDFAVVCDGMVGMGGGKLASVTAIEKMRELLFAKSAAEPISQIYIKAVNILNECVCSVRDRNDGRLSAGTTIVVIVIEDNVL